MLKAQCLARGGGPQAPCSISTYTCNTTARRRSQLQPQCVSGHSWTVSESSSSSSTQASCQGPPVSQPALATARVVAAACRGWSAIRLWAQQQRVPELLFGHQQLPGLQIPPVAALLVLPVLPGGGFNDLFTNKVFIAGFWAWFTAQFCKIFTRRVKKGVWDVRAMLDSGGMPSSHSALCAGVTTAIAMHEGLGSSTFAVAIAMSSIVMYDAAGVRRHAGKHAEVLNQVVGELLEGHPVSELKLKEVLGHTPLQVCAGALLGILMGIFFPYSSIPSSAAVTAAIL